MSRLRIPCKYAFVLAAVICWRFSWAWYSEYISREYLRTEMLHRSAVVSSSLQNYFQRSRYGDYAVLVHSTLCCRSSEQTYVILVLGYLSLRRKSAARSCDQGFNTLSQLVLNIRPVIVALLWCVYVFNEELLRHNFCLGT